MTTPKAAPIVWRSILYVPSDVEKFVARSHERGADCVLLDLEDSVIPERKELARTNLRESAKLAGRSGSDVAVRINRPLRLAIRDLEAAVCPEITGAFIAKSESAEHLQLLDEMVSELEVERGLPVGHLRFVGMIESPKAMGRAHEIAQSTPRLCALTLGGEDFALESRLEPNADTLELPKKLVAIAARSAGLPPLGVMGTVADYSDPEAYRKMADRSRAFGFEGATCIHPSLVDALNAAFTPDPKDVDRCRRIMAADAEARAQGRGSFSLDGKMIDIPVVERAKHLLARADAIDARLRKRASA